MLRFYLLPICAVLAFSNSLAQADFKVSGTKGCVPLTVNFTDLSTGAVQWEWDFGNGNTSTLKNPSAIYYASGSFTVTLKIKNTAGNSFSTTKVHLIRVFKNPKASFYVTPNPVCTNEPVVFLSNSSPGDTTINQYSWDFGNGTISNNSKPSYAYQSPGNYSISLVVTDGYGCQDKLVVNNALRVKPSPKALFSVDSSFNCKVPTTLWFKNNSTGGMLSYKWQFADGNTSTAKSPLHTYTSMGYFSPSLTVTDTNGCSNTMTATGMVYLGPITADFTAGPTNLCGSGKVSFSLTGGTQPSIKYEWDFGDGNKITKAFPDHIYTKPGVYTVKMTASSIYRACSSVVEKKQLITIHPKPDGKISISDSFPCKAPFTVQLRYQDTMPIEKVVWEYNSKGTKYGAGSGLITNQIIYDYEPRMYTANVTTKSGCNGSVKLDWEIQGDMVVAAFAGDTMGCIPLWAELKDKTYSKYPIKSWRWVFHTRTESYTQNVKFLYLDTGVFPVKLYVKTEKGCTDSVFHNIHAGTKTQPSFYLGSLRHICNNSDEVKFYNSTKFPGFNIDSFKWIFDDMGKSAKRIPLSQKSYKSTNVKHYYDRDSGLINPMLVSYHHGCGDTVSKPDSLYMKPPYAIMEFAGNPCLGDSIKVKSLSTGADSTLWTVMVTDPEHKFVLKKSVLIQESVWLSPTNYYNIILKVWNFKSGCWDTVYQEFDPPKGLSFCNPVLSSYCAPATVDMCTQSQSMATRYYWTLNFTDTIFNQTRIKYSLTLPGEYQIGFTEEFGNGCTKTRFWSVKVDNGEMRAHVTKPTSCLPATIKLIDSTWVPGPVIHAWRVSNGDVIPVVAKEMNYTIHNSFTDSLIFTLTNEPDQGLCRPFKAFSIHTTGPGVKLNWAWNSLSCTEMRFIAHAEMNPNKGVKPFSFLWNTGDGSTYSSQLISHKFRDTGWFKVSLTVTDANNCKVNVTENIYVPENRLMVKIKADTLGAACPPLYVSFKDISHSGNIPIKSWEWDFGDGVKSSLKYPQHQYLVPGKFPVTLKITDEQGCSKTMKFPDFITISGPYGKFSIDKKEGCFPLYINFSDSLSRNTAIAEWDFGDGVVNTGFSPKHSYFKPGRYIPALVLTDSLGCKFPVPPVDTIHVYDYPIASFSHTGICLRDTVMLNSLAQTRDYPINNWYWEFHGDNPLQGRNVKVQFNSRNTAVKHVVTTTKGCRDSAIVVLPLKQPSAYFKSSGDTICLGSTWKATGYYENDTTVLSREWFMNNQNFSALDNIEFSPGKSGQYHFRYKVTDVLGCWDTASKPWPVSVGDTTIPPASLIRRVSVENDNLHHIKFEPYPSFDFRNHQVFREDNGIWTPVKKTSNRWDTILFLGGVDALKYSYCYKLSSTNLCGYTQDLSGLHTHCTVELGGKPAVNASLLKWSPYAGWPVQRYVVFRENHKTPGSYDSIGQVPGTLLNYTDTTIVCYVKHKYKILAHESGGKNEWSWSDTCQVKPIYVNTVPPPGVRRATVIDDKFVRLEWQELKKNKQPLDYFILEKFSVNHLWTTLSYIPAYDSLRFNDKNTLVDDFSYTYRVISVDECGDRSEPGNVGKSILLKTTIDKNYRPVLNWTAYRDWPEGVKQYVVEKRNENGFFTEVGRTQSGDTNFIDEISSLNCVPVFEYRIYAIRNLTTSLPDGSIELRSYSNIDAPPVETKIFVPNAFTPNNNALNETFRPDGIYIAKYNMKIFDRWGSKIYENDECMNSWNGDYNGLPAPDGVYIYIIQAKGSDGRNYNLKGNVTLIR